MERQITLRVPAGLARGLARRARERGIPKSQVVREALRGYLEGAAPATERAGKAIVARYRGAAPMDQAAIEADELARQLRAHNWRE